MHNTLRLCIALFLLHLKLKKKYALAETILLSIFNWLFTLGKLFSLDNHFLIFLFFFPS